MTRMKGNYRPGRGRFGDRIALEIKRGPVPHPINFAAADLLILNLRRLASVSWRVPVATKSKIIARGHEMLLMRQKNFPVFTDSWDERSPDISSWRLSFAKRTSLIPPHRDFRMRILRLEFGHIDRRDCSGKHRNWQLNSSSLLLLLIRSFNLLITSRSTLIPNFFPQQDRFPAPYWRFFSEILRSPVGRRDSDPPIKISLPRSSLHATSRSPIRNATHESRIHYSTLEFPQKSAMWRRLSNTQARDGKIP